MAEIVTEDAGDVPSSANDVLPQENFALAVPVGIAAAGAGALVWAAFVYVTNYELGLIAIAIGALVGLAIRKVGNGFDPKFSILGAACAGCGAALGIVLSDLAFLAKEAGRPMLDVASAVGPGELLSLAVRNGDPIDLLFLAIAVYEGWKLSVHRR